MRLGEYDFSKASNSRRDFAVDAIFMHEEYDRKTYKNDMALIRLKEKATFNDMIWPICLPPSNTILEGQSAYVTGEFYYLVFIQSFCKEEYKIQTYKSWQQVGAQRRTAVRRVMFFWKYFYPSGNWKTARNLTLNQSVTSSYVLATNRAAETRVRYLDAHTDPFGFYLTRN